ncbi:EAL domain-containing protein [Dechloromonas denitrificans]|uniref:EAL domain-containing protein n=1 Tax=Dechloromonas denitrificans TaxID=281362 RepID=UPI001CF87CC9|nr:EAL domain-containing protein [Dechloromonas denitrificans]UCV01668.1 EAL domain-containing protein [Dechloromonas denitrificans]
MPLSDLIRTLNAPTGGFPKHYSRSGLDQPFVAANGSVFLHYANIRLESKFLPIVDTATGKLHGHAASLQAFGLSNKIQMAPEAVFVLPTDDEEFVYLDRLVRTLHALNYLTKPARGNLLLKVHSRHVLSIPAHHGLAFEEILRPCGLFPEQVTLEIDTDGILETDHLIRAVTSYRSRGYGIAIGQFGRSKLDFGLLRELQPDIIKLDHFLLSSARPLKRIVDCLHQLPSRVMIEGKDTNTLRRIEIAAEIDLVQANVPARRLLHAVPSLAAKAWDGTRSAA